MTAIGSGSGAPGFVTTRRCARPYIDKTYRTIPNRHTVHGACHADRLALELGLPVGFVQRHRFTLPRRISRDGSKIEKWLKKIPLSLSNYFMDSGDNDPELAMA